MQFITTLMSTILCMILIYALLSLLVSTLTEAINSYLQERSQLLFRTISRLFEDGINVNFGQLLYSHPMVDNLKKDTQSLPQYMSDTTFAAALIDVIANYGRTYQFDPQSGSMLAAPGAPAIEGMPRLMQEALALAPPELQPQVLALPQPNESRNVTFERFTLGVMRMQHTPLKLLLMNIIEKCTASNQQNPLEQLEKELQVWYNNQMERVTGWYKNWIRTRLFYLGLVVALVLNIDSIHLFQTLYRTPDLRARLEPIADQLAANYASLQEDSTLTATERAMRATMALEITKDSNRYKNDTMLQKVRQLVGHLDRLDSMRALRDTQSAKKSLTAGEQLDNIVSLGIPIGWRYNTVPLSWQLDADSLARLPNAVPGYFTNHLKWSIPNLLLYIAGILITAFSLSAGAPFWFDLLLKFVNLRRAGVKPAETKK